MRIHWEESATTKTAPFRRNPLGAGGAPTFQTEAAGAPQALSLVGHDEKMAPAASVSNLGARSSLRTCNPKTPARGPRDFCHGLLVVVWICLAVPTIAFAQTTESPVTVPRMADGRPNLQGIWQVRNRASYDLQDHVARLGMPAGRGVVEGGQIPYQPLAAARKTGETLRTGQRPTRSRVASCPVYPESCIWNGPLRSSRPRTISR